MADRVYLWRDLRFDLPAGFDDDTLLTFSSTSLSGGASGPSSGAVSLTVARDTLTGALDAWAKSQEQGFAAQKLPAYAADGPRALPELKGDAKKCVVVDRRFNDDDGDTIVQRQAFVALDHKVVAIVTATTRASTGEQAKKAVVDVVTSLQAR